MAIDPTFLAAIGTLVDRYGLPLALLVGLGWALFTRRLVMGSEMDRTVAAYEKELAYREDRRGEERANRLATEGALREISGAVTKLADAQEQTAEVIIARLDGREVPRGPRR